MPATTRAETYTFLNGFPTDDAALRARDDVELHRAIVAYRFWFPTVNFEGVFNGLRERGVMANESVAIWLCEPRHLVFTPNCDTPYGIAAVDLKDGPMVMELPPGPYLAVVLDHNDSWLMDGGVPGPDAGKGGKHLALPPDYLDEVPDGYYVARSATNQMLFFIRVLPSEGDLRAGLESLRNVKVYPLASAQAPEPNTFVDLTDQPFDFTLLRWEDNLQFWHKLHEIIDSEPLVEEFALMYGLLAALGIEKGKPFAPDARMKAILERAATEGRDQMLVSAFASTRPDRIAWSDRKWEWAALISDNAEWMTASGTDLEARDRWYAQAQGASPAMFRRKAGSGSLYWLGVRDKTGAYLDGGNTYTLTIPQPAPAKLFWSVTVYDASSRCQIQTNQDKSALRSMFEFKDTTSDAVLHFGPNAPAGNKSQWIKTIPGKGWFVYLRLYGPEKPAFDRTWRPGDFEPTD
jgi:hypothetical protein